MKEDALRRPQPDAHSMNSAFAALRRRIGVEAHAQVGNERNTAPTRHLPLNFVERGSWVTMPGSTELRRKSLGEGPDKRYLE
jgi:hypothetical protein